MASRRLERPFDIGDPLLRTLDALHLASALLLGEELTAFVSYDQRLPDGAHAPGLVVTRPGQLRQKRAAR